MLAKLKNFVKAYQSDVILIIGAILISFLSFAMGFIAAKMQEKEQIKIESMRFPSSSSSLSLSESLI